MIVSKTPFRMSFVGGGSDLPAFYREELGAVVSTSIDKHMYIAVKVSSSESGKATTGMSVSVARPRKT